MRISRRDLNARLLAPVNWVRDGTYTVQKPYRLAWFIVLLHHIAVMAAGVYGFIGPPPPSITQITGGEIAQYVWSVMFIFFGFIGIIARVAKKARAEVVSVLSVAGARTLWAVILFISVGMGMSNPGTMQIAVLMLSGALFLIGWSVTTLVWISGAPLAPPNKAHTLAELLDVMHTVVDEQVAQDGE